MSGVISDQDGYLRPDNPDNLDNTAHSDEDNQPSWAPWTSPPPSLVPPLVLQSKLVNPRDNMIT